MTILWGDFETRSRCDLPSRGGYNYSLDASTSILCFSYAFGDDDVQTWTPDQPFPESISEHIRAGKQLRFHNAGFDRQIFWNVLCQDFGVPKPALHQFYCTATQARANCLPGSLEDVGRAISSNMRKDHRGSQLIRALSIPRADGSFNDSPELMAEMVAYCEQDVRTMRAVSKAMRPLSDQELADYHTNERINDRGVLLDLPLAHAAVRYASVELEEIETLVADLTKGEIKSVRSPKMKQWVIDRVGPQALKMMEVYKDGEQKYSIDKSVRANLLVFAEENHEEIPAHVADVIQCADDLWASSVAKFSRLAGLADEDDHRVRGAFVFAGGSATGRASSYGAQVHNFTRKCAAEPDDVRHAMVRGHSITPRFGKRVTDVLRSMLRPALIPAPGKQFVVADWSAVEARVTAWASADPQADEVLQVFRDGRDIYKREAAGIYRVAEDSVDKEQRQIGKVAILSLGFGGAVGAFSAMGRNYGVVLPESDSRRIVDAWRRANAWAVRYWGKLEDAYTRALRNPGREFTAGRVTYLYDKQHLWYALPSGRILCYPFAKFEGDEITYVKAAWKPAADATEWPRARLWRGLACENITQAVANDLLRHALRQLDDVVLHVHDEIVLETADPDAPNTLKQVMCTPPDWAAGLPLNAEVDVMSRYGKG
jgi:DNA polymerase bacteriophage-type